MRTSDDPESGKALHRTLLIMAASLLVSSALLPLISVAAPTDNSPPVVNLVDSDGRIVRNGTAFGSGNITIICLSLDELSDITKVEYSIDGSSFEPTTGEGDLQRTTVTLTWLEEGNHTIVVRATNSASLSAERSATFTVDADLSNQPADSTIWGVLSAIVAMAGIALAVAVLIWEKKKRPEPAEKITQIDELPPII